MPSHSGAPRRRGERRHRQFRPSFLPLEQRAVPALTFPGIDGIAFDSVGDVFVSYDSSTSGSGQQQSVAEVDSSGYLSNSSVFSTTGSPGALADLGPTTALPTLVGSNDILELQPSGQLNAYDPTSGTESTYDNLPNYTPNASNVFDVQTGGSVNLSSQISLNNATYGDFGVYSNSLVIAAESNNWDFVMRLTYGSAGGAATVLVASPASDGLSASPEGVAVDSAGTVLTTLPYMPAGSSTAIHVPVGFSLFYDTGSSPAPSILKLGLASVASIDAGGIAVDSESNFILATVDSSLYGGGGGVVHVNSALTAFLADPITVPQPDGNPPVPDPAAIPTGIATENVQGTDQLAFTDTYSNQFVDPYADNYVVADELPLFSGQVSAAQLRHAYGIDQINFTGPGGTTVVGDGSGQTIAIVEEGVDPTLGADLTTFDQFFGIPAPPSFQIIDQNGVTTQNPDIIAEASLDVEWAHAVAPGASIVVYNAAYDPNNGTTSFENLFTAMNQASKLPGVSVVTLSYGGGESASLDEQSVDSDFTTNGVTFLAASGDTGIYGNGVRRQVVADYPAASPNIVAVGGTSIVIDSAGDYPGTGTSGEVAWGDGTNSYNVNDGGGGGGGLSEFEAEPAWQAAVIPTSVDPTGARALPDVSMDSGSAQEYDVFTSTLGASSDSDSAVGWLGDAGTSAASPIWAGLIAIADQGRVLAGGTPLTGYTQTLPALYSLPSTDFHDILYGNNGDPAGPGYDLATGLGTPVANLLVPDLAGYQLPSQITIKTEPPSSVVAGATFSLTVQVADRMGNPVNGGTVTVEIGNNPAGGTLGGTQTEPVENGLATFSDLALSQPGANYTLIVTASGASSEQTTSPITVTGTSKPTASLSLSNLSFTYDGSSHTAVVTTNPAGLTGVSLSYTQNGGPVASPTHAGNYTVTATLDNPNYVAQAAIGTLVISQATPVLAWAPPASITAGTPLSAAQLDATASFDGSPLAGTFTYTPSSGSLLAAGNGQALSVSFAPTDGTDFKTVNGSVTINVLPQSPPPPQVILLGVQPIFERKLKKNGKPAAIATLTGFRLQFNIALASAGAANPASYQIDIVKTKKVRKKIVKVLQPFEGFTVTNNPGTESVTINLAGTQSFPNGGQIKILPGITNGSDSVLSGITTLTITPGAKKVRPS
jgi:MBG domain-containing protein